MKSGQRGSHGITLVSRSRQSNDSQTLTRKKSVESLAVKQKPTIKTVPSQSEDFRLEVRQNTLMEETCALADLLDLRHGLNRLKTESSRRHQLRASSAPKCEGMQMVHATPTKKGKEKSPSVKTFESTERSLAQKSPSANRQISTRLNIDLEQIIQSHVKKNLKKGNTEIESIFAKGIRKKLAELQNTFRNSTSAFPTPTFRKALGDCTNDINLKLTRKKNQGKQNKKFLFD